MLRVHGHINVSHSSNQELQFSLVEHGDEGLGNDLEETVDESVKLFLDATHDPVVDGEIDVLALVLFGDWDFRATGFEVDGDEFTEPVFGDGECFVQDIGDIVLTGWIEER